MILKKWKAVENTKNSWSEGLTERLRADLTQVNAYKSLFHENKNTNSNDDSKNEGALEHLVDSFYERNEKKSLLNDSQIADEAKSI
ncbi:Hypothetical predicted protein [Octopus vulgaris]|uniref:Uncharacterized protein n=1 Tax=Octopus vulgaris TaxID=6645 RepID=A0AA36AKI7_OCTVU|nr:Hypothetical predicted protein [Octopus vulgaris]